MFFTASEGRAEASRPGLTRQHVGLEGLTDSVTDT